MNIWRKVLLLISAMMLLIGGLLIQPFVAQAIYFESHRSEIKRLIAGAAPTEKSLPHNVYDLLLLSMGGHSAPYAATLLIQCVAPQELKSQSRWSVIYASWTLLVVLHFSEQERLTLIAHVAPTGGGNGLENTAQKLFNHSLSEVSLPEAGVLAALVKAPFLYERPDQLAKERDRLLAKYHQS